MPESETVRVIRPGAEIAVHRYGDGAPVLAIHGFASSARANWVDTGWARAMTSAGRRLLAVDLRGHGDSSKPHEAGAYRLAALLDDITAVLDDAGADSVDVVGYSLGAYLAIQLALSAPPRVRSLTLGGVGLGAPFHDFDVAAARRRLADGVAPVGDTTAKLLDIAAAGAGNDMAALLALADGLQQAPPVADDLPAVPLTVVNGERDDIAIDGDDLARRAPRGRFQQLPGRTHVNAISARAFKAAAMETIGA